MRGSALKSTGSLTSFMSKNPSKGRTASRNKKRFFKRVPSASVHPVGRLPVGQPYLFEGMGYHPSIIPRPEHCISRKDIDKEALKVLYGLKNNGYIAYLVGGSVRDLLLGKRPKDFDVGTNAKPEELRKIFRRSRIIGRRFKLVHVYFRGGKIIEVSTFRHLGEHNGPEADNEGAGDNQIFGSPQEDAFRRDITINGLFYNIADFSIIDYIGGMADLKQGVVRAIGDDPERKCMRDPVRMMRAVRHAARTGFGIEADTWEAILIHSDKIRLCSVPRVRDEWVKDLRSAHSRPWAELMLESGLFASVFSGYVPALECRQGDFVKNLLLGLLEHLDRVVSNGAGVSESFMLAVLVYPRLHVTPEWQELRNERIRWPTCEVRSLVEEILSPYDLRRSVRDITVKILASQWSIPVCLSKGNWPKRVWSKPTFNESVMLYDFVQEALGLPVIGPDPHLAQTPKPLSKPRSKKRRRSKTGGSAVT